MRHFQPGRGGPNGGMSSGEEEGDLAAALAFLDACADAERPGDGAAPVANGPDDGGPLAFLSWLDGPPLAAPASLTVDGDDVRECRRPAGKRRAAAGAAPRRRRPPSYNSNQARQAQAAELRALRATAQSLELTLLALQAKRPAPLGPRGHCQRAGSDESPGRRRAAAREAEVWKEIAGRQMEHRVAAESECRRLQQALEAQEKLIAELQHLVFCKATAKAMDVVVGVIAKPRPLAHVALQFDPKAFGPIMRQVETAYRDIDRVFQLDVGQDRGKARRGHMHTDADGHLYFQIFGSKVFPFDVETTADAAWKRFSYSIRPNDANIFSKFFAAPDDTVAELFATELRLNQTHAVLLPAQIKRLFKERDRVAIVWESRVDAVEFMGRPLAGAEYRESGYFLIERPPLAPEGFAVLRTCYVIAPTVPTHLVPQDSVAFALMKFVFKWMASTIPANHQILEDMLILRSATGGKTRAKAA